MIRQEMLTKDIHGTASREAEPTEGQPMLSGMNQTIITRRDISWLDEISVQHSTRGGASSAEHSVAGLLPGAGSYPAPQRDSDDVGGSHDSYEEPPTHYVASSSSAFSMEANGDS